MSKDLESIHFRLVGIYHSCLSSAAFKREDAVYAEQVNANEAAACRREADVYETIAGLIYSVIGRVRDKQTSGSIESWKPSVSESSK